MDPLIQISLITGIAALLGAVVDVSYAISDRPACVVLSRPALPTLDRTRYASSGGGAHGAFVLADAADGQPDVLLLAESLNAEYRDNVLPHTPAAVAPWGVP